MAHSPAEDVSIHELRGALKGFAKSDERQAWLQVANTLVPYIALWGLLIFMVHSGAPFLLILPVLVLAALFLVRIFIFFHDCAHGSFFASRRANMLFGYLCGFLTFTPFTEWQVNHLVHHRTYADLDARGVGDIWTLTVEEYLALPWLRRLGYRLYRNPLVFLGVGPGYTFLIAQRFIHGWKSGKGRFSVHATTFGIVVIAIMASLAFGFWTYLLIQLPLFLIAGAFGVWLFYVQHQFEGVYWARHEEWDPVKAALDGSSHYDLPKWLQWFTGNIGLHHVHHVLPRIPNYKLQASYDANPAMQNVRHLTLKNSIRSLFLNLWDEERQQLVSFGSLRSRPR